MLQRAFFAAAAFFDEMAIRFRPDSRLQIHPAAVQDFSQMARHLRLETEVFRHLRELDGELGPAALDLRQLLSKLIAVRAFRRFAEAFGTVAARGDQIVQNAIRAVHTDQAAICLPLYFAYAARLLVCANWSFNHVTISRL